MKAYSSSLSIRIKLSFYCGKTGEVKRKEQERISRQEEGNEGKTKLLHHGKMIA